MFNLKIDFIISILCCSFLSFLNAQDYQLDVDGDIRMSGRLQTSDGGGNIFIGPFAGENNTEATFNIGIGHQVLRNSEGGSNTAIGGHCLDDNYTGSGNTALGRFSLRSNTVGDDNTAAGYQAMYENFQGNRNTALGVDALYNNVSGHENVAIGHSALYSNFTGQNNTAVGYRAFYNAEFVTNSTAIGHDAYINASNNVRIGNYNVTAIGGHAHWIVYSDKRLKKNIKKDIPGLEFITKLRPVSYQMDIENIVKWQNTPDSIRDYKSEAIKGNIRYSGFLAQEVEAAAKAIDYDFSGVDVPKNEKGRYGLRYSQFVMPLVKAVQELNKELTEEKETSASKIQQLEEELAALKALLMTKQSVELRSTAPTNNQTPKLSQNKPNPFNGFTTIDYFIPKDFQQALIRITDSSGRLVREINIDKNGAGQIDIDATNLNKGNYFYYLVLDGQTVESKQMILLK